MLRNTKILSKTIFAVDVTYVIDTVLIISKVNNIFLSLDYCQVF